MIHEERLSDGRVVVLTLDRPERRNALSAELCDDLTARVAGAADARVIVVEGAGPHFCAGADLSGVEDQAFIGKLRDALDSLAAVPCFTMAAVHGAALGAGMQLAIACDVRVATPDARFGIPAAKLGLMVDHPTVQRVALQAGASMARSILLAADEVNGERAHTLGLVNRLGGRDAALAWASEIADLAPLSIAGHKLALNHLEPTLSDGDVQSAFERAWGSADVAEGRAAFAEKRPPRFSGH